VDLEQRRLTVEAVVGEHADASLELYTADARKDLAVEATGLDISFDVLRP
jgi:hypothetical protein